MVSRRRRSSIRRNVLPRKKAVNSTVVEEKRIISRKPLDDAPFVDKNKKRITMSIGIPIYNELEKGHLHETINNAIAVGFDDIVILDDGSTDGTWAILKEYATMYPQIRVFRNKVNSVLNEGSNRWKFVVDKMAEKKPDWIVVRAADQIYSYKATVAGGDLFRKRLTELYHEGVGRVSIPLAHLWRSRTWYRNDGEWGSHINTYRKTPIWRYHVNYSFEGRELTGAHLGWHHPTSFGFKKDNIKPISASDPWLSDLVILHLGHTTHSNKVLKFKWSVAAATANHVSGRSIGMPPPDRMPPVRHWLKHTGYKGFYEFNMELKKAPNVWFAEDIGTDIESKPPIAQSFYYTILEYNPKRAAEYKRLFEIYMGKLKKGEG